ncbi:type II toxin-antitoxin system VapC family toxin [Sphingomonas sp.]|uniref:type II toxin-antitoxin system VapC family toxin n=1 Tax=Sphingomonas sp. TaxID=28214 RepID=UPI0035BBCA09
MPIFVDTQAIVWAVTGNSRLSRAAREALTDGGEDIFVSAVTAYEFVDLNRRGRFEVDLPFRLVLEQLEAKVLDYPSSAWTIAETLPPIHFDQVDRMLIAHAIHARVTLVTADTKMRSYPVLSIW